MNCIACPYGQTSPQGGICVCPPGYAFMNNQCIQCPSNSNVAVCGTTCDCTNTSRTYSMTYNTCQW